MRAVRVRPLDRLTRIGHGCAAGRVLAARHLVDTGGSAISYLITSLAIALATLNSNDDYRARNPQLTDTLARSARAILIKGGGVMEAVLDSVRRWRQPVVVGTGAKP